MPVLQNGLVLTLSFITAQPWVHSIGLHGDTVSLLVSGGIGVVQLVAVLPAIVWIDKVGRRPLLRGVSVFLCSGECCLTIIRGEHGHGTVPPEHSFVGYILPE